MVMMKMKMISKLVFMVGVAYEDADVHEDDLYFKEYNGECRVYDDDDEQKDVDVDADYDDDFDDYDDDDGIYVVKTSHLAEVFASKRFSTRLSCCVNGHICMSVCVSGCEQVYDRSNVWVSIYIYTDTL